MKNLFCYFLAAISIIVLTFAFVSLNSKSPGGELLSEFGWEFQPKPIETAEIIIPEEFDEVFENYNELQKKAGLDLKPYMGKRATRYTYIITNYPDETVNLRGNVLVVDGVAVGGDISTVELGGFMEALNFNLTNF